MKFALNKAQGLKNYSSAYNHVETINVSDLRTGIYKVVAIDGNNIAAKHLSGKII